MIEASRAPSPESLGCLSQEDLATSFEALGAERDTFVYRRAALVCRGLPFLAEVAFAYAPDEAGRQLYAGLNFRRPLFSTRFLILMARTACRAFLDGFLSSRAIR